jgi:hypothetical protein
MANNDDDMLDRDANTSMEDMDDADRDTTDRLSDSDDQPAM